MVAINFSGWWTGEPTIPRQKEAVFQKILGGKKDQTIRKVGKRRIAVGDRLQLYWHMRQKDCEKISEAVCTRMLKVKFDIEGIYIIFDSEGEIPEGKLLEGHDLEKFAERDGFPDSGSFLKAFDWEIHNVYRWELIQ